MRGHKNARIFDHNSVLIGENSHLNVGIAATSTQQGSGGEGILHISSLHEIARSLALENLHIKGKVSLPSWIGTAPKLTNVTLSDTEMDGGDALRRLAPVEKL